MKAGYAVTEWPVLAKRRCRPYQTVEDKKRQEARTIDEVNNLNTSVTTIETSRTGNLKDLNAGNRRPVYIYTSRLIQRDPACKLEYHPWQVTVSITVAIAIMITSILP